MKPKAPPFRLEASWDDKHGSEDFAMFPLSTVVSPGILLLGALISDSLWNHVAYGKQLTSCVMKRTGGDNGADRRPHIGWLEPESQSRGASFSQVP